MDLNKIKFIIYNQRKYFTFLEMHLHEDKHDDDNISLVNVDTSNEDDIIVHQCCFGITFVLILIFCIPYCLYKWVKYLCLTYKTKKKVSNPALETENTAQTVRQVHNTNTFQANSMQTFKKCSSHQNYLQQPYDISNISRQYNQI